MTSGISTNQSGYVLEVSSVSAGFIALLKQREYIGEASPTAEGIYIEPRTSLDNVLDLFERAGAQVRSFRAAGTRARWQESNVQRGFRVLSNPRSAAWLPTVPAA